MKKAAAASCDRSYMQRHIYAFISFCAHCRAAGQQQSHVNARSHDRDLEGTTTTTGSQLTARHLSQRISPLSLTPSLTLSMSFSLLLSLRRPISLLIKGRGKKGRRARGAGYVRTHARGMRL